MKLKFGVRAHDVGKGEVEDILNRVHEHGFRYVQLVFKKALENSSYEDEYILRVKKALVDNGVKVALLGAYFNPVHSDKSIVEKGIKEFKENLRISKTLGIDIVGSETGSYNDSPWTYVPKNHTEEGFQQTLAVFKELKDYAYEVGSSICVEGAYGHVIYDVKTLKRFVDILNDKGNVYVTVDLFNLIYMGNYMDHKEIFKEALTTFKDRIRIIHLKDFIVQDEKIVQVAPGMGNFDYPYMLKLINEYCPNAKCIFEGVTDPNLVPSLAYLLSLEA